MKKRVAFIFAFPIRTNPMLITMPFGLNVITLLDRMGYEVDIYLGEYRNDSYNNLFSSRVKIHFLDHNYMWPKEGIQSYWALTNYFKILSAIKLRGKYSHIFASGMAGIRLGAILKTFNRNSIFVYMNDELPGDDDTNVWVRAEKKSALKCDVVVSPDELRIQPLRDQIPGLDIKSTFVLPNSPLLDELLEIPEINWYEHFKLPKTSKLFLVAGGLSEQNMTKELLESVPNWPSNSVLILKGKHDLKGFNEKYARLLDNKRVVLSTERMNPDVLHSLHAFCTASICLYKKDIANLVYIGKSSGKLMRSLLLGRPAIVTDNHMDFVLEKNLGIVIQDIKELPKAVEKIIEYEQLYRQNCTRVKETISYEYYWDKLSQELNLN